MPAAIIDQARALGKHLQGNAMVCEWEDQLVRRASGGPARFKSRQNPHSAPAIGRLLQQNSVLLYDKHMRLDELFDWSASSLARQGFRIDGMAKLLDGTNSTFRLAWQTDQRAKIEKGGIVTGGAVFRHQLGGSVPKSFAASRRIDWRSNIEQARDHASGVCLNDGNGSIESERRDGIGSVTADPWECANCADLARENSAMSMLHNFRHRMQIMGPIVVAEALPGVQNLIFGSVSKGSEIRKSPEPVAIVRQNARHLSLLKHEFGDDDGIRVTRPTPRQIAPIFIIPIQ